MMKAVVFIHSAQAFSADRCPRDVVPPFFLMQTMGLVEQKGTAQTPFFDLGAGFCRRQDVFKAIASKDARIVVVSFSSQDMDQSLALCREIKQGRPDVVCIAAGHAATYCTGQVCHEGGPVDYAVRGEYPFVLSQVLEAELQSPGALESSVRDGSLYSPAGKDLSTLHIVEDIDSLPTVPRSRDEMEKYHNVTPIPLGKRLVWGRVFTTYGCPNACLFCTQTVRVTYGQRYRLKRVDRVIEEMQRLKGQGANIIEFMDDNFTTSRPHVAGLCEEIIKKDIGLPWGTHARIDEVDREMLALMKRAGCAYVRCGIESGSPGVLKTMQKTDRPSLWADRVRQFFEWTRELGVCSVAYVVLGAPGEKTEDVASTKELVLSVDPDIVKVHSFCAYPGSRAFEAQRPESPREGASARSHHGSYPSAEEAARWRDLESDFVRSVYLRPRYLLRHARRFSGFYLLNPRCTAPLLRYAGRIFRDALFRRRAS